MRQVQDPIILICVFLWIGFVCAISFMEAWLKFKAPGVTLRIGLNIGRKVFNALNKVELVFAIIIAVRMFLSMESGLFVANLFYFLSFVILLLQTFLLLPVLDARANAYITGRLQQPSKFHLFYVVMEVIKTTSLFIFGITLFN